MDHMEGGLSKNKRKKKQVEKLLEHGTTRERAKEE